jgi:ribonuclease PH
MTRTPLDLLATIAAADALRGLLSVSRALVEAGREVDLAGLEDDAARLCAAVACLPPGAAAELRAPLEAARLELDRLHAALAPP